MARAQDQKRWRDNSGRRRVEVYLPDDAIAVLDKLASERGQSRAGEFARLLADAPAQALTEPQSKGYSLRKAKSDDSFDWLVIVDGEPLAGIQRYEPING